MRVPAWLLLLLAACNGRERAQTSASMCDDGSSDVAVGKSADSAITDDAPTPADTAFDATSEGTPDADADSADADMDAIDETSAWCSAVLGWVMDPMQTRCGVDRCDAIFRLDDGTNALMGWRARCEPRRPALRQVDAERIARAFLVVDSPFDTIMTGAPFVFWRHPTAPGADGDGGVGFEEGGWVYVDPMLGVPLLAATVDTTSAGGALVYPREIDWKTPPPPDAASLCVPTKIPAATPTYPVEDPLDDARAAAIAKAAWNNAVGRYWEKRYGSAAASFTAAVMAYAPTFGGTRRDDYVVVSMGTVPCAP